MIEIGRSCIHLLCAPCLNSGGGGGLVLGRGESGGRADKGSDDGRLHD